MKLDNVTGLVAVLGGAAALYMFVKWGGVADARRDLSKATGGRVSAPDPAAQIGERQNGAPTFGVTNPWARDPIFAPYQPPTMWAGGSPSHTPAVPLTTGAFGVGLN